MKEQLSPEYLDLNQLAIYTSVARNTLKKWLKSGMPHYRVGRCIRVRVNEFNDWMNQFRAGTSQPNLETIWDQVMKEV